MSSEPWQLSALCAQVDPEIFFVVAGGNPRPAQQVCLQCPVRNECLQYALDLQIDSGVWGGTTPDMRQRLRTGRAA